MSIKRPLLFVAALVICGLGSLSAYSCPPLTNAAAQAAANEKEGDRIARAASEVLRERHDLTEVEQRVLVVSLMKGLRRHGNKPWSELVWIASKTLRRLAKPRWNVGLETRTTDPRELRCSAPAISDPLVCAQQNELSVRVVRALLHFADWVRTRHPGITDRVGALIERLGMAARKQIADDFGLTESKIRSIETALVQQIIRALPQCDVRERPGMEDFSAGTVKMRELMDDISVLLAARQLLIISNQDARLIEGIADLIDGVNLPRPEPRNGRDALALRVGRVHDGRSAKLGLTSASTSQGLLDTPDTTDLTADTNIAAVVITLREISRPIVIDYLRFMRLCEVRERSVSRIP